MTRFKMFRVGLATAAVTLSAAFVRADRVSTFHGNGADSELRENGGVGTATSTANSSSNILNVRWNFAAEDPANRNRNEWIALKFDLSGYPDKSMINGVTLNMFTFRADTANNERNLQLYALRPGTVGEDWDPLTTTYATMPGFTFDMDSSTNILDTAPGGALIDLGTFNTAPLPDIELEGTLITVPLASLTSTIKSMGASSYFTVLMTYVASSNGQFRIPSREAAGTNTGVLSGAVGDFAPYLEFTVGGPSSPADFNGSGSVNGADLAIWKNNYSTGTTMAQGDANGDMGVDGHDLLVWQREVTEAGGGVIGAIPEPSSLALGALAAIAVLRRRGR